MSVFRLLSAAVFCLIGPMSAQSHEFWIEPMPYSVGSTDSVNAGLRNGQFFEGVTIPYIPAITERFEVVTGDAVLPVEGRLGDRPALNNMPVPEGLAIVVYESTDSTLTYDEWQQFADFVRHKDLAGTIEAHSARGLPDTGFDERYRRYSKALIGVGNALGADRVIGLRIEIVAGANPYTDDTSGGLPLQVYLDGQPRPDAQIELFERAPDGTVAIETYRTDAEGRATVPVKPGHAYLADSVAIRALEPAQQGDPVWHTDWAALTFAVPE
jgi:uncharacterized GH25 family protein